MSEYKNLTVGTTAMLTLVLVLGVVSLPAQAWAEEVGQTETVSSQVEAQAEHSEVYDEAMASIAKYNKLAALKAAVAQVQQKEPVAVALWDMSYGVNEIRGLLPGNADYRYTFGGGGFGSLWLFLAADIAVIDGVITEDEFKSGNIDFWVPKVEENYKGKTFQQLIDLVKSDRKYASLKGSDIVKDSEEVYARGVASLRKGLKIVDPKLTGLETKNGDELAAIYDNLTLPYTEAQIEAFNTAYHLAYAVTVWDNIDNFDIEGIYGELVEATKAIDPNFTVDLTGVELLEPGNPVQPEKPLPSLPNTGVDNGEDNSAKMIEAAVIGVAALVLVTGGVVTAKRFILSPLKRKH